MNFTDLDYINRVAPMLPKFHWTRPSKVSLHRCLYCGDSAKNSRKTRGCLYYVPKLDKFCFKCFNCGESTDIGTYLKDHFPQVYSEYKLDRFRNSLGSPQITQVTPVKQQKTDVGTIKPLIKNPPESPEILQGILELPSDHVAVIYVKNRLIPYDKWQDIYYTEDLHALVNELVPGKYTEIKKGSAVVFLLKDTNDIIFGLQARAIDKKSFVTLKFDDEKPKIYGEHLINYKLPIFVTEAIIDSLFLPNSLAIVGGDFNLAFPEDVSPENVYVVLDNEPRHKDTVKRMEKSIDQGVNVCFWEIDTRFKDINDMVKDGGFTKRYILEHIVSHSFRGPIAKLKLSQWKKI